MKNLTLIIIGLLFTINLSAQTCRREIHLAGRISERYPIKMTLTISGEKVLGYYYYEKYKTKILLEGQVSENKISLKESPDYETEFKTGFIGELGDASFTGIWTDKLKNKSLKCELSIKTDKQIDLEKKVIEIVGTYESIFNSETYFGAVQFAYITEDLFCFEISNGTESGCVGYLKGLIKLTNLKSGIFSGDGCEKLEFQLSSNELTLLEENCDFHGMRCPFEGKYKKEE